MCVFPCVVWNSAETVPMLLYPCMELLWGQWRNVFWQFEVAIWWLFWVCVHHWMGCSQCVSRLHAFMVCHHHIVLQSTLWVTNFASGPCCSSHGHMWCLVHFQWCAHNRAMILIPCSLPCTVGTNRNCNFVTVRPFSAETVRGAQDKKLHARILMCVTVSWANSAQGGIVQIRTYVRTYVAWKCSSEMMKMHLFVNRASSE